MTAVAEEPGEDETRVRLECAAGADPREEVFRTAVSRGWVLRELTREAVSLEDVFVRLTRHEEPPAGIAPASPGPESEEVPS